MSKSFAEVLKEMQAINNNAQEVITTKVINHLDNRVNGVEFMMKQQFDTVMVAINEIKSTIAPVGVVTNNNSKPQQTPSTQPTRPARTAIKAIGMASYMGKEVPYYAVCADCGEPIVRESIVEYCLRNSQSIKCFPCQRGTAHSKSKATIISTTGEQPVVTGTPTESKPSTVHTHGQEVIVNCDICGTARKYKSADDYLEKKAKAESLNLHGSMCVSCARKEFEKLKAKRRSELEDAKMSGILAPKVAEPILHGESEVVEPILHGITRSESDIQVACAALNIKYHNRLSKAKRQQCEDWLKENTVAIVGASSADAEDNMGY